MKHTVITRKLAKVKLATRELRQLSAAQKNNVLRALASALKSKSETILRANRRDLKNLAKETPFAFVDRLTLTAERITAMGESLEQVALLADPVNEVSEAKTLKNGLKVRRVRSPLGVIFMIFESRPNVAIEAFSLAFKAGNAVILRGGKEAKLTTAILFKMIEKALKASGVQRDVLWGITESDRALAHFLLKQKDFIDVVVPRGGDGLIQWVVKNSLIPIIRNDRGLCHVYVHEDADLAQAARIVVNAKTQRPGVCNAMETLLVHEGVAVDFLQILYPLLQEKGVLWYADRQTLKHLKGKPNVKPASLKSWGTEYLDLMMNCRVVKGFAEALAHIEKFGSHHSEVICTQNEELGHRFQSEVDAAAVYWNASTRFTDGFELGLGGELGISTQKIHVRGPVGLKELTSLRWVIDGTGQIRS